METKQVQDKLVKMNCSEKLGDYCLVCLSKVDRLELSSKQNTSLSSKNLNVIFLLRNLLQVPDDQLQENSKECRSPANWIRLCDNCSQLNSQAMELHLQILTIVKIITDKIKESSVHSTEMLRCYQDELKYDKVKSMEEKRLEILKRTRDFVTNYTYNIRLVNPFIEEVDLSKDFDDEKDDDISLSESCGDEEDSDAQLPVEDDGLAEQWQEEQDKHRGSEAPAADNLSKCRRTRSRPGEQKQRRVQLDNGKWKCRFCEKVCGTERGIRHHLLEKHLQVPGQFVCNICGKKMNSNAYLTKHLKRHQANKIDKDGNTIIVKNGKVIIRKPREIQPKVPSSSRTQEDKPKLLRREVQENGKWKCRYCDKEFAIKKCVWSHEKEKHPSVPGQFECDICGKTFNSKLYLNSHRYNFHKINNEGNPVVLKPKKRYKYKPRVKPEEPSICDLCGKSFNWGYELKKHLKLFHEKKFEIYCSICGMGVYAIYNLNMHLMTTHKDDPLTLKLIEEGARLWKCGVVGCRARFLKESGLEEHSKKVHCGGGGDEDAQKNRFACSFCGKAFRYAHRLKCHEDIHKLGTEKPHSCDICGAKFRVIYSVRKHQKRFHADEINK